MTDDPGADQSPLDATLLGRPVHLLPQFAARLRHALAHAMRQPASQRHWGPWQVGALEIHRAERQPAARPRRWLAFGTPMGPECIGFSLERGLLLDLMRRRYGTAGEAAGPPAAVPVTATEERLLLSLGQQMVAVLAACVAGPAAVAWHAVAGPVPLAGGWIASVALHDGAGGLAGRFWFALDQPMMMAVLQGLAPPRPGRPPPTRDPRPLAARLELQLTARLASKRVTLGRLLDLRIGDVLPINLKRTAVLLGASCLFTAAVAEHDGMLCLTSFDDAE